MLTNKEIGKRIEELRTKHGFSQANLATFLGIDQSLVSRIERGERTLNESLLDQLSALFGITVKELTEGTGKTTGICCALRASDINADDMQMICAMNRIVLNAEMLSSLLNRR